MSEETDVLHCCPTLTSTKAASVASHRELESSLAKVCPIREGVADHVLEEAHCGFIEVFSKELRHMRRQMS